MADPVKPLSVEEQVQQLGAARKIAVENPAYYDRIVKGILPIIGPSAPLTLRRWGAEFLVESLASPTLPSRNKEGLTVAILETLRGLVESSTDDTNLLKATVMAATSAYPIAVKWIIHNSYHLESWQQMTAIKAKILSLWDGATTPVKISCIKFVQEVVLAQTASNGTEKTKSNNADVSLTVIPPNHAVLNPRDLEAEAMGLLDRMLTVLQDNSSDVLVVDSTINVLSFLIRSRPVTSGRIVNAVLNFNPMTLANSPMTPATKGLVKSIEKATRTLLIHLVKRDPSNPMAGRIQAHVEKLVRARAEILDDASRKRAYMEQMAHADSKRQKLNGNIAGIPQFQIPPLPPLPLSLASVFTLTPDTGLQSFDVTQVPVSFANKISTMTLASLDLRLLEFATNAIRSRLQAIYQASAPAVQPLPPSPDTSPLGVDEDEDDDDYEPNFYAAEDTEQILNKLDSSPARNEGHQPEDGPSKGPASAAEAADSTALAPLGAFKLVLPPPLDPETAARASQVAASRVFGTLSGLDDGSGGGGGASGAGAAAARKKAGINRLAASSYDRDSWLTMITRLATRSTAGLEEDDGSDNSEDGVKVEDRTNDGNNRALIARASRPGAGGLPLSAAVREMLYGYVLEDFRRRIEVAVAWLCEEWYNDQLTKKRYKAAAPPSLSSLSLEAGAGAGAGAGEGDGSPPTEVPAHLLHYDACAIRLVDGLLPYLTAQDKVLTRFLAEIPELGRALLGRLKGLCRDPTTVQLALTSLLYLVMMKPPAREAALDTVAGIWTEFEDARPLAARYLHKWRPGFIEAQMQRAAAAAAGAAAAAEAE